VVAALSVVVAAVLGAAGASFAAASDFPRPAGLETQIEFWKKVFAEYSENQIVVHDNLYLDKIYRVIDLRPLAANGASDMELRRAKKAREQSEKNRIDRILASLATRGDKPEGLDADEREVFDLFRDVSGARKFTEARERVRAQTGLRERFARGVEISRRYLPHMEQIFRDEGLPIELTRLPFVESSFNIRAYSKVGAAGLWQFIPSSARIYLRLNEVEDLRRDPLASTRGAARHLRDDYEALGTWPLAITAYNHGRAGMARAVSAVGTRDLAAIVRSYHGKGFGFASRNFYTEFLAALEVERDHQKHFGELRYERKIEFQEVQVQDYLRFSSAAKLAGVSTDELHELNPGFSTQVVDGKLYVPRGTKLRVPAGRAASFRAAYAKLPANERFASQRRIFLTHKVTKGQTIGAIAKRYKTTVAAIQVANRLRDVRRIRTGMVLKIPTG
jgi:membrane-bound lytic murein transglycosylase D